MMVHDDVSAGTAVPVEKAHIDMLENQVAAGAGGDAAEGISTEEEQAYIRQIEEHKQAMERALEDLDKAKKDASDDRRALEAIKVKVTNRDSEIESLRTQLDEAHAIAGSVTKTKQKHALANQLNKLVRVGTNKVLRPQAMCPPSVPALDGSRHCGDPLELMRA